MVMRLGGRGERKGLAVMVVVVLVVVGVCLVYTFVVRICAENWKTHRSECKHPAHTHGKVRSCKHMHVLYIHPQMPTLNTEIAKLQRCHPEGKITHTHTVSTHQVGVHTQPEAKKV